MKLLNRHSGRRQFPKLGRNWKPSKVAFAPRRKPGRPCRLAQGRSVPQARDEELSPFQAALARSRGRLRPPRRWASPNNAHGCATRPNTRNSSSQTRRAALAGMWVKTFAAKVFGLYSWSGAHACATRGSRQGSAGGLGCATLSRPPHRYGVNPQRPAAHPGELNTSQTPTQG